MGFKSKTLGAEYKTVYQTNQSNQTQRKQALIARFVDVITINPLADGGGSMTVSEKGKDGVVRHYIVQIDPERLLAARKKEEENREKGIVGGDYSGASIDKRLVTAFNNHFKDLKGAQAVLENTYFQPKAKEIINGETYYNLYTSWIRLATQVTSTEFKHPKVQRGIITADADLRNNRARTIQLVSETCISANDEDKVNKLCKKLDKVMETYNSEFERGPNIGVRLLACHNEKTEDGHIKIFETSGYFDWLRGEEGQKGHPLDSESLRSLLKDFDAYIKERFPNVDFRVEILYYRNYLATNKSKSLTYKPNMYSPLKVLVNTPYKASIDDTDFYIGKYHAALGVVMFSGDKYSPRDGRLMRKEFVNHISFDSINGNVLKFIRASSGEKFDVPEYLHTYKLQPQNNNATTVSEEMKNKSDEAPKQESSSEVSQSHETKPITEEPVSPPNITEPPDTFDDDIPF